MDLETLRWAVETARNEARDTGQAATATITINGRECPVTATIGKWPLHDKIKIEYKTSEGRTCTVNFIYNEGEEVAQEIQSFRKKIDDADHIASRVSQISSTIAGYIQPKPIDSMDSHAPQICEFLKDTANFVRENDLFGGEISTLKQGLRKLCGTPIIKSTGDDLSINEWDHNPHCRAIALRAESLEILLDARACGQIKLERNIPPLVRELGRGTFNTVRLAHTKPGVNGGEASGPIALKSCDQSKSERNQEGFAQEVRFVQSVIGTAIGSYRHNQATSKTQDMLCAIGKGKGIGVPHVITTVSAAEMNGIPCIAMEMLEGKTVGSYAKSIWYKINYNNEFICRETWIQIQDVLTGQIDRHEKNVMLIENEEDVEDVEDTGDVEDVEDIEDEEGEEDVGDEEVVFLAATKTGFPVAFDNDLSFPTNPPRTFANTVPWTLVSTFETADGSPEERAIDKISRRNYCMPPIIDREMYIVIMSIDLPALEAMYEECGLTRREIGAAMARARGLQTAAQQLQDQGLVIEPDEWESSPLVQAHCNEQNFYALRHFAGI